MKHVLLLAGGLAAVGACNTSSKIDKKNASPAEVAQQVREAASDGNVMHPGLWQTKITIERFDMPAMPPDMAQMMETKMAESQGRERTFCLTAEDAQKPREDFFAGKDNRCRYEQFTMGDGKIDALMHCGREGGAQTLRLTGTYAPDSYQMHMASEVETSDEGEHAMQMQMRVESRRIGQCKAKQG
jgi:hypothetical protein